jgi:hypothetical protein
MADITVDKLIEDIQSTDDTARAAARDGAGPAGAAAVPQLAKIAASDEMEVARAANKAIQNIVYYAGRPGAEDEAAAVAAELLKLLGDDQSLQLRRDALWMTWQIAGEEAVEPVAVLLSHAELREDARMALERLPGDKATAALQQALEAATGLEKAPLAHSLGVRGIEVSGVPDQRLVPTRETAVKPVGRE